MKIDFSKPLTGLDDQPLKEGDKEVRLSVVCVNALLAQHVGPNGQPEQPSGTEKMKRYILAKKIHSGGMQSVTAEEVALIKQVVEKSYGTLVVGIANAMLEGEEDSK